MKTTPFDRLTPLQVEALEKALNPKRVRKIGNEDYLPIKDVNAKLNELFGFGGWSREIITFSQCLSETREHQRPGDTRKPRTRNDVGYLCHVRIRIHTDQGDIVRDGLGYVDSATYAPNLPNHQTAALGAVSAATKSAAKTLGNQFGLTLGNPDDPYGEARAAYDAWRHEQETHPAEKETPEPEPTADEVEANQEDLFSKVEEMVEGAPEEEEPPAAAPPEPELVLDVPGDIFTAGEVSREDFISTVEQQLGEAWRASQKRIADPVSRRDPLQMLPEACRSPYLISADGGEIAINGPADLRRLTDPALYWLGKAMEQHIGGL
jgi:hypothetical protein